MGSGMKDSSITHSTLALSEENARTTLQEGICKYLGEGYPDPGAHRVVSSTSSTRRFFARPSSVLFDATGA
jgi:hypothetical protein